MAGYCPHDPYGTVRLLVLAAKLRLQRWSRDYHDPYGPPLGGPTDRVWSERWGGVRWG